MKYIQKRQEPASFTEWKSQISEDWQPTWEILRSSEKRDLHDALLREQGYICCYCEMRITQQNSHIEHLKPRTNYPTSALDYANLLASCQRERSAVKHCAYKKDDWYDEQLMVSPLKPNCADFFRYTEDGRILPTEDASKNAAAVTTIDKLGLNADRLVDMRSQAIDDILENIDGLTEEEINLLISGFQELDANGQFEEFSGAIAYILKQYSDYYLDEVQRFSGFPHSRE